MRVSPKQAIVGFPKFSTIGIGFMVEDDWNTNLPYQSGAKKIWEHIKHNREVPGDELPTDEDCKRAIKMVIDAATAAAK